MTQCEVTCSRMTGRSCDLYSKAVHVINMPFLQQTGCSEGLSLTHEVKRRYRKWTQKLSWQELKPTISAKRHAVTAAIENDSTPIANQVHRQKFWDVQLFATNEIKQEPLKYFNTTNASPKTWGKFETGVEESRLQLYRCINRTQGML